MRFHTALPTILFLLIAIGGFSQSGIVRGFVRDQSGQPVPQIQIWEKSNPSKGTATDDDGKFSIAVPAGKDIVLVFKGTGAKAGEERLKLDPDETRDINVTYDPTLSVNPVIVRAGDGLTDPFQRRITTRLRTELPTINAGIEKFLIQMPVNFSSELSSSYSVRGGSFDENLVYVNDIQVYRPFLVRSGEQEGLSFANPDMVSSITFSGGGFQAKFGDKMSSVLDIQYARPDSFYGAFQVGLLGTQLQLADISKNRKWTHNSGFRYRDNSYVLKSLDVSGDYKPRFTDFQTYITYRPAGEYGPWELAFLGNASSNYYNIIPKNRETDVGTINEALRLTVFFDGQEITRFRTAFGAFSAKYMANEKTELKFITSSFQTQESEHYDVLGAYRLDELERDLGSDKFGEVLRNRGIGGFLQHGRNDLSANVTTFSHRGKVADDKNDIVYHWGADYVLENVNDRLSEWRLIDSAGYASPRPPDSIGYVNGAAQGNRNIFVHDRAKAKNDVVSQRTYGFAQATWTKKYESGTTLALNAGLRGNHWSYNGQTVISPRVNLAYTPQWLQIRKNRATGKVDTVRKDMIVTAAWGYYYQPPFYREMRRYNGTVNQDIRAQLSIHYILGMNYVFRAWNRPFKLITEAYYKQMKDLIPYELDNVRQRYLAKNDAVGYATGLDVMVNGEFIPGVQSWLRASYLRTFENLKDDYYYLYLNSNGDTIQSGFSLNNVPVDSIKQTPGYIPRPTDRRLSFSMLFQDEMPKRPEYKVLLNLFFATGVPFGPVDQQRYNDVYRTRSYFRADIGFSRDLFLKKKKNNLWNRNIDRGSLSLEVFNLLGVNNIINHQWIEDASGRQYGIPTYLTGRRINLRFTIHF